jgi:hypothetical protein
LIIINGYTFNCKEEIVYEKIMAVAKGKLNKEGLIKYYEKHSKKQ